MATRRDTRTYSAGTTSDFPKMPAGGPEVVNASATPSSNTELVRKPVVATVAPTGPPLEHRTPEMIDGHTGQALGDLTEQAAAGAARHLTITETVDRAGASPREQQYLDHIFGRNLPGRA